MTVSEAIIKWLKEFNPDEYQKMQRINTDLMHNDVDYALVKEPVQNVRSYVSGMKVITEHYQFRARLDSINDNDSVDNSAFMESLTGWIEKRNWNKDFPSLQCGTVQEIGVSTPFYLGASNDKKAIYQLTIFIRYIKKENES